MEFTGKIIAILHPKEEFQKLRQRVESARVCYRKSRPISTQNVLRSIWADKIDQFNIQMGEELTVSFDIDSNQWQDRWFNRIRAWKVERVSVGAPMATGGSVPPAAPSAMPEFTPGDAKDDLPF